MKIAILGATGSVGTQALDVIRSTLPNAEIQVLTGFSNIKLLASLVCEFNPKMVCVPDSKAAIELKSLISTPCEILTGESGLVTCAVQSDADIVVNALVGRVGLAPTLAAINSGKNIALANKETLVTAGELIMNASREKSVEITPMDSEHSAIWQCLQGNKDNEIEKIIVTASGGPFRTWSKEKIKTATAKDALKHPNWSMGPKITIDSATLMNKGLEVIEAMWLFNQPLEKIEVLVHPQSIIHSAVQFTDGSIISQMGTADMRLPILYALSAPKRVKSDFPRLDFLKHNSLTFEAPDMEKFPCLKHTFHAAKIGGTLPAVMNMVNEWAVGAFLQDQISFCNIPELIDQAFGAYSVKPLTSIDDVIAAEEWALDFVRRKG